jgi:endo-1,3(4)-beta-glucanase
MPYATMLYAGATPRLTTQHAIVSVNGTSAASYTGRRFELALNNGQTWIVYASQDITVTRDGDSLTATAPLTGSVRVALAPAGGAAILDAHAGAIPVGGTVRAESRDDTARIVFDWQVEGAGELLTAALPHHREVLDAPQAASLSYSTIKGEMIGVVGAQWTMNEPLPTITWTAPRPIDASRRAAVGSALAADAELTPVASDPYFFGKQVAAMGRLALIADELDEPEIAAGVRGRMATALAPWLATNNDKLVYDTTWGGIVAAGAQNDPGAAFGQGYYNDHHFHYGYFLYAAATLARGDSGWAEANGDAVLALARDIANPNAADTHFTPMRNKDWFAGHSWAAGLFEFADSRNQESSSEAVNAWYGLALWGKATGDQRLYDLGRLLLATELRSVHAYWQVSTDNDIYGPPFSDNKVVGVLWATKVDYATFFGANVEYIHGIQMLPFTPITELLLPASWIAEEYPVLSRALERPAPVLAEGWRGYIYMAHSVIDPAAAWTEAQALTAYDDGNTATNTLYWIATRPQP